jgi:hypothetical protein
MDCSLPTEDEKKALELRTEEYPHWSREVEAMAESAEVGEEKRSVERSLEDVLAGLEAQLQLASREDIADSVSKAEGYYHVQVVELEAQVTRLQAQVTGLRYEKRLLEQRVKSLEAPSGWRPSRWARKRAARDASIEGA